MSKRIENLSELVKQKLENAERGHDYWHAIRVCNSAIKIAAIEGGNLEIIKATALLHDIADAKFNNGDETIGISIAKELLTTCNFTFYEIEHILEIIAHISFNGGIQQSSISSIEFVIVQDADRLDALGAIGIARAFHYGGFKNRELYNPSIPPQEYANASEYRNSKAPTINHFYEKLLKLKNLMNTKTGKIMAQDRHNFMKQYLEQFYEEWGHENGEWTIEN